MDSPPKRHSSSIFCSPDKVYIFGGVSRYIEPGSETVVLDVLNDLWVYDVTLMEWEALNSTHDEYPSKRLYMASTELNDYYSVVATGFGSLNRDALHDIFLFDKMEQQFTKLNATLPEGSRDAALLYSEAQNSLYIFGGRLESRDFSSVIRKLDLNNTFNEWSFLGGYYATDAESISTSLNFPRPRRAAYSGVYNEGNILILYGGALLPIPSSSESGLNDLWYYNLTSSEWLFISGSRNRIGISYSYNQKGIAGARNSPGGRFQGFSFVYNHAFYVFGGSAFDLGVVISSLTTRSDIWYLNLTLFETKRIALNTSSRINNSTRTLTPGGRPVSEASGEINGITVAVAVICLIAFILAVGVTIHYITMNNRKLSTKANKARRSGNNMNAIELNTQNMTSNQLSFMSLLHESKYSAQPVNTEMLRGTTYYSKESPFAIPGYLEVTKRAFQIKKQFASGGFSKVYLAKVLSEELGQRSDIVVLKVFNPSFKDVPRDIQLEFIQELAILSMFRENQAITTLLGYCLEPCSLIMKYYSMGALDKVIKNSKSMLSSSFILTILKDVSSALQLLHEKDVAHLDVKPVNILLEKMQDVTHAVLSDFGVSHILSDKNLKVKHFTVSNTLGVTISYAAPESIIRNMKQTFQSPDIIKQGDVYSLACSIYEILTRFMPWKYKK
jgi:tRNA A-37 threonylcarbamoyl transferase component Bud32